MNWPDDSPRDSGLTEGEAEAHVHGIAFKTGPPRRLGVELEWLVRDARDPALPVPAQRTFPAVADLTAPAVLPDPAALPSGSMLTTEPGGQLELSSAPADGLGECVTAVRQEMTTLRDAVGRAGLSLQGYGYDPIRPPRRVLDLPRYAAMEEFFDRGGPWGRLMMCSTASVQVCLDAGQDRPRSPAAYRGAGGCPPDRPGAGGRVRQLPAPARPADRLAVDPPGSLGPARSGPHPAARRRRRRSPGRPGRRYALDAELLCVRRDGSPSWSAPPGLTFRDWLRGPGGERRPTLDDLTTT